MYIVDFCRLQINDRRTQIRCALSGRIRIINNVCDSVKKTRKKKISV